MAEFAGLTDLKAHLNVTKSNNDGELGLMLDAAEDVVRSLVGSFSPTSITEVLPVHGGTVLLSGRPTGAVTVDGGDVTGFVSSPAAGVLYGLSVCGPVTVSYMTGDGQVPAAVTLATLIIAAHLWETQRGAAPSPLSVQDADIPGFGTAGFAIPNRAKELLQPFVRSSSQVA